MYDIQEKVSTNFTSKFLISWAKRIKIERGRKKKNRKLDVWKFLIIPFFIYLFLGSKCLFFNPQKELKLKTFAYHVLHRTTALSRTGTSKNTGKERKITAVYALHTALLSNLTHQPLISLHVSVKFHAA